MKTLWIYGKMTMPYEKWWCLYFVLCSVGFVGMLFMCRATAIYTNPRKCSFVAIYTLNLLYLCALSWQHWNIPAVFSSIFRFSHQHTLTHTHTLAGNGWRKILTMASLTQLGSYRLASTGINSIRLRRIVLNIVRLILIAYSVYILNLILTFWGKINKRHALKPKQIIAMELIETSVRYNAE